MMMAILIINVVFIIMLVHSFLSKSQKNIAHKSAKKIKKKLRKRKCIKKPDVIYLCSTELMFRIWKFLLDNTGSVENMVFILAIKIPGTNFIVPTSIIDLNLGYRSVVSVIADPVSIYEKQVYASKFRIPFGLICHSHPGIGPDSVRCSSIDRDTHQFWERNYPLIGVIFDQSKYFGFFSATGKNFEVKMIGEGVKYVRKNVYCFD